MIRLIKHWLPYWLLAFAVGVIVGLCSCVTVHIPNKRRFAKQMLREMEALNLAAGDILHYVDSCQCSVTDAYRDSVYSHYLKSIK